MTQKNNYQIEQVFGALPRGVLENFLLAVLAVLLTAAWGGPRLGVSTQTGVIVFFVLLLLYLAVSIWCIKALPIHKMKTEVIKDGPYKFVRHPMYGAIIFLLNPALAFVLKSWLVLLFLPLTWLIWKVLIKEEEAELLNEFPDQYSLYQKETGMFFPNLLKVNKFLFFAFWGLVFALAGFTALNYKLLSEGLIVWDNKPVFEKIEEEKVSKIEPITKEETSGFTKIEAPSKFQLAETRFYATLLPLKTAIPGYDPIVNGTGFLPVHQNSPERNSAVRTRVATQKTDSIAISALSVEAPLVTPANSSEKEINAKLNNGVVIYPGSALPPDFGNLFLTGHSSSYFWNKSPYTKIFAGLNKLSTGDKITVTLNGFSYEYTVFDKKIVNPDEAKIYQYSDRHILTLMTCWPIGSAKQRVLVYAEIQP